MRTRVEEESLPEGFIDDGDLLLCVQFGGEFLDGQIRGNWRVALLVYVGVLML